MSDKDLLRNGFKPRLGQRVRLWGAPGLWSIWSKGGSTGTWFIQPIDDEARSACADSSKLNGIEENCWGYAIEVKTKEMGNPHAIESSGE